MCETNPLEGARWSITILIIWHLIQREKRCKILWSNLLWLLYFRAIHYRLHLAERINLVKEEKRDVLVCAYKIFLNIRKKYVCILEVINKMILVVALSGVRFKVNGCFHLLISIASGRKYIFLFGMISAIFDFWMEFAYFFLRQCLYRWLIQTFLVQSSIFLFLFSCKQMCRKN